MRHVLLLLAFLISGAISQPIYAYQDTVCHIMTSDSIRLYVHVKGEGPMCLYLHGGPGSGSTWMEAVSGHILEKRFTMVYLDQRGVCKSETPKNDDFSFARQIQDWEEVRQALGIDHWLLMGHSWGGILMMGYWKAHPNVIDGMMFINCTLSRDTSFEESWLPRAISILGETASPVAKDESRPFKERMMAVFPQLNDDNRWMLFTPNKWANDSIGSWRFHKDCISHGKGETPLLMDEYGEDFRPLTSAIKVPVLYLYGRQDYAVGPEHYKALHFPNAVVLGADCGHMVFLEEPAVFAETLDKFCHLLLTPINDSTKLSKEQVLAHMDELRKLIDEKIWPTYNDPAYSMEMNYYEEGPFRMHLNQAGANTEARMECSSPEITIQAVPSVKTYEEWYAMLMHECFHGFQYKHTAFWNKMLASTPDDFITSDSLKALRLNYEWYRNILSKENALLKKAYNASDIHEVRHILTDFYSIRKERLKTVKDRLGLDIIEFYPIIETVEGSARYIEYRLAHEQGITDTDWMTNLDSNSCYYASGLYLMLIMDKFGIPYKDELFQKYYTLTELIQDRTRQEVKILIEIRPEVNYVTHLYSLAELGFSDSTYAAKYGNTLPKAAIDTLQKHKNYLTFGQGEGGMLAWPFFFGVSAENIPNVDSMQVVMNVVINEGKKANAPADVMAAVRAIANVYVAHYDAYLKNIYPQVKADMEERCQLLSQKMQEQSFVKDWERVTGYTWRRGDYHWLLYRAGQKGPSYNNLNDSTNTVWYNQDIDYQLAMFSHEFGIFLMQDSIDPIVEEMKDLIKREQSKLVSSAERENARMKSKECTRKLVSDHDLTYVPWSAFESLACWYNCKIAGRKTADYHAFGEADVQTFCEIFDRLSNDGISDPAELYRKGVMEYLK